MELLLSHWHCILPIIGIAVAMFFMRDKNRHNQDDAACYTTADPSNYRE